MNLYKKIISIIISVIFLFSLTACDNTEKAYIYFYMKEQPQTLDPQTAKTDEDLLIVRNIFEGLLRKDEKGKIVCGVAESYNLNGLTYTFKLKKDAIWSNEVPITAHDFVFAFKRAVKPETKSPFVKRLFTIKNAKAINKGKKDVNSLGVKALDTHTLQIILNENDKNFEETLTTSIAMPCNEAFFYSTAGKYGLENSTTISNGSYRLAKWNKEIFGIRLYSNKYYKGDFIAKNAAVFFTMNDKQTPLLALKEGDADIAFKESSEIIDANQNGFKTDSYNNIVWYLTISDGFSKDIRKSLISLANPKVFTENLTAGYYVPKSIYPDIISQESIKSGITPYNLENSKNLFTNAIQNLKDKKFPTNVVLYYYDDDTTKNIVTDIVGHWQNQLSAFVNIESVSSPEVLLPQLKNKTYALCIFPVRASSQRVSEFLENFGINYSNEALSDIQKTLLKSKNITPLFTQDTVIAYSEELNNVTVNHGDGCIDFAYIVKDN
jgi:oligopeptide transport system substrate-binding protein